MREWFLPIIVYVMLNVIMVISFNKSFGRCMPFTFILSALLCYIAGVMGLKLRYGLICVLIISLYLLVKNLKNLRAKEYIEKIFSNGFFVFVIVYIVFVAMDYGKTYLGWDEFAHWEPMLRIMINKDILYTAKEIYISHKNYPAFMQCFEYIWCRLQGGLCEWGAISCIHIFGVSVVILPIVDMYWNNKKILDYVKILVLLIVLVMSILTFDVYGSYNSIYLDIVVALYFVYVFILIDNVKVDSGGYDKMFLAVGLAGFILLKDVCIVFLIALIMFYVMREILEIIINKNKYKKNIVIDFLIIVVLPMVVYVVWKVYTKNIWVNDQFNLNKININEIINVLAGKGNIDQIKTKALYVDSILSEALSKGILKTTLVMVVVMAIIFTTIIFIQSRVKMTIVDYISYETYIIISFVGYVAMFFIIYEFFFSNEEMLSMASFTRYMGTYALSIVLLVIYILIKYVKLDKKNILMISMCVVVIVLCIDVKKCKELTLSDGRYDDIKEMVAKINENNIEGKKIYVMMVDNDFIKPLALTYYAENIVIDRSYMSNDIMNNNDDVVWKKVKDEIKTNDYLYIYDETPIINMQLKEANGGENVYKNVLYKVGDGEKLSIRMWE